MKSITVQWLWCLLILLGISLSLSAADPETFSDDPDLFFPQLEELMTKAKRNDSEKTVKAFIENCTSGKIQETRLEDVIKVCNIMADKRMRAYPHFTQYLNSINNLVTSGNLNTKFENWHGIVKDMADNSGRSRFKAYEKFVKFSETFFDADVLHRISGRTWIIQTIDYNFGYVDKVPVVNFGEASLYCYTAKDTLSVIDTKGTYNPTKTLWTGESGRVTWERAKLDPNEVYATIGEYKIDLKKGEYSVEDAILNYNKYLTKPLKGKIVDKLSARVGGQHIYPQFDSYDRAIKLENLAPQMKYYGGFGLHGGKIIGFGTDEKKAMVEFFSKDDKLVLRAFSKSFAVKEGKEVNSQKTTVSLYFAEDSIYHPRLNLHYLLRDKQLRLVRDGKASSKIAFMSSYHQMEANVDAIFWSINTPTLEFSMVSQLKNLRVVFESFNLYDEGRLQRYRRVTSVDPVAKLKDYADSGQFQVPADEFAKYLNSNYTITSILGSIFDMVEDGFIYYDPDTDIITIREKTINYIESRAGNIDYDRIALISESDQENAQLDLETKELIVTGVKNITVSDSQKVVLYPYKGLTRVKKNRDIDIDGTIIGGNVDFTGKDFRFAYDEFFIKMDSVDKMQMYIEDETGKHETVDGKLAPIKTVIRDVNGTLLIDEKDNKSGRKSTPSYPKFESNGNSYLYYNSKKLYDGAYKSDNFFFKLDPFSFEDLDNITPELLTFPGEMVTGNIFPKFKQTTSLQEDLSLGFVKETDAAGMPAYGKGTFHGTLNMSNQGLIGVGNLKYLNTTLNSPNFTFLPDSMMAGVDSMRMTRTTISGVEFPNGTNQKVTARWLPKGDSLIINMVKRPFYMFEDKTRFRGNLVLTKKGLLGGGKMNWKDASISADHFTFTSSAFKSDSSNVIIKNENAARVAFNSENVKSKVDMDQMLGEFFANGESIPIDLPYNKYATIASEYYWLMNDNIINLRMPDKGDGGYFVSTHPDQDSLKFAASGGVVNLNNNTVKVDGVPFIEIADAKIRPRDTQVFIDPDAKMRTLERAMLVCDTIHEYHKLTKVKMNIYGKNNFKGSGQYSYRGKDMKKQKIKFKEIIAKEDVEEVTEEDTKGRKSKDEEEKDEPKAYYTFAKAKISENRIFRLSNNIEYKGSVSLDSRKPFLVFDGFAKIDLVSEKIEADWFKFTDQIDPENIQIDVSTPIGERKDTLTFGIMQDMDSLSLYPTFLIKKHTPLDAPLFTATGELDFNPDENIYRVANQQKLSEETTLGNMYTLEDEKEMVYGEGRFNLGRKFGLVDVDASGYLRHKLGTSSFILEDFILGIDFFFDEKLLEDIGQTLSYYSEGEDVDYSNERYIQAALELVDEKERKEFKDRIYEVGYMANKVKGLDQTLILSNLNMVWDTVSHTLRSKGGFAVNFIGDKYVNRPVNGFVEFGVRQSGDFFNLYFEVEDEEGRPKWYYFNYKNNKMRALSSDNTFNQTISKTKDSKRRKEGKVTAKPKPKPAPKPEVSETETETEAIDGEVDKAKEKARKKREKAKAKEKAKKQKAKAKKKKKKKKKKGKKAGIQVYTYGLAPAATRNSFVAAMGGANFESNAPKKPTETEEKEPTKEDENTEEESEEEPTDEENDTPKEDEDEPEEEEKGDDE